jgi:hypothetical protein
MKGRKSQAARSASDAQEILPQPTPFERHFKPSELAKLWGFGVDKIRAWFQDCPGVLIEDRPETCHKRGYKSMRIPASVAERVYRDHLSPGRRAA